MCWCLAIKCGTRQPCVPVLTTYPMVLKNLDLFDDHLGFVRKQDVCSARLANLRSKAPVS